MSSLCRRFLGIAFVFALVAMPALAEKKFMDSDDAKEKDEPHTYLPDYDKLVKGHDADWVYFPNGSLKSFKTVSVKEFDHSHSGEARDASRESKDYMEQWLEKQGFKVVKTGGDIVVEGNVFNAWEPHGAARYWGGWAANPGVGQEVIVKDSKGKIVAEVRHKSKGSTIRDAVENGLEDVAKAFSSGR